MIDQQSYCTSSIRSRDIFMFGRDPDMAFYSRMALYFSTTALYFISIFITHHMMFSCLLIKNMKYNWWVASPSSLLRPVRCCFSITKFTRMLSIDFWVHIPCTCTYCRWHSIQGNVVYTPWQCKYSRPSLIWTLANLNDSRCPTSQLQTIFGSPRPSLSRYYQCLRRHWSKRGRKGS